MKLSFSEREAISERRQQCEAFITERLDVMHLFHALIDCERLGVLSAMKQPNGLWHFTWQWLGKLSDLDTEDSLEYQEKILTRGRQYAETREDNANI